MIDDFLEALDSYNVAVQARNEYTGGPYTHWGRYLREEVDERRAMLRYAFSRAVRAVIDGETD